MEVPKWFAISWACLQILSGITIISCATAALIDGTLLAVKISDAIVDINTVIVVLIYVVACFGVTIKLHKVISRKIKAERKAIERRQLKSGNKGLRVGTNDITADTSSSRTKTNDLSVTGPSASGDRELSDGTQNRREDRSLKRLKRTRLKLIFLLVFLVILVPVTC